MYSTTVVLPYYKENEALTVQDDKNDRQVPNGDKERKVIYKRHRVSKMPADVWGHLWPKLHQQLHHVEVKQPNSIPALLYPTLETTVVWGMRLALAVFLYRWVDKKLYPVYKLPNPQERPVLRRPKLSTSGSMDLGSLGQSRYVSFLHGPRSNIDCEQVEVEVFGHRRTFLQLITVSTLTIKSTLVDRAVQNRFRGFRFLFSSPLY